MENNFTPEEEKEKNITPEKEKEKEKEKSPRLTFIALVALGLIILIGGSFLTIRMKYTELILLAQQERNATLNHELAMTKIELKIAKKEIAILQEENLSYWEQIKIWWNDDSEQPVAVEENIYEEKNPMQLENESYWSKFKGLFSFGEEDQNRKVFNPMDHEKESPLVYGI